MNILIPINSLKVARKLLTRIPFARLKLPALTHVLATIDAAGLSLAVTDLDHWLEIRVPATLPSHAPASFLIPAEALAAAARGDRGSSARLEISGDPDSPVLKLTVPCGGMAVDAVYHPETSDQFPPRPTFEGQIHALPKETFQALAKVATCASTDATRYVLNGVLFSPADGGILIATDGRRLAGAPAKVPCREFVLPNAAARVLCHPDFLLRDAAIIQPEPAEPADPRVQFRSGPLTFIARTIEGQYPDYRRVIPAQLPEIVTIQENRKPALISWLCSQRGRCESVRLTWETPGHVTLTQMESDTTTATLQVPVVIEGKPPEISFSPAYLADALEIGSTLKLTDELSPGIASDSFGNFCVLMSRRDRPGPTSHQQPASTEAIAA